MWKLFHEQFIVTGQSIIPCHFSKTLLETLEGQVAAKLGKLCCRFQQLSAETLGFWVGGIQRSAKLIHFKGKPVFCTFQIIQLMVTKLSGQAQRRAGNGY